MARPLRLAALLQLLLLVGVFASTARSGLVISRADRKVDLTSHIVRILSSLKVENVGSEPVSQVLLAFPNVQAKNLAAIRAFGTEGKVKGPSTVLPTEVVQPSGVPPELTFFSASLPKALEKGKILHLDVLTVFTHSLQPFPEEITQVESQLVVYQDSAHYLSPYPVKVQTLSIRLPGGRVESYTKYPNTKLVDSELKYGPFEDLPPFSYSPVIVHFENNNPFAVAKEVIREIEISHWGNVQITEHYNIAHGGARLKGEFSRIDYQSRPYVRGVSSFRHLIARLPARAHSIYYRDEISNISTSHLWSDSKKTQLEIEPRFPLFGGWQTTFTIGYGLPLQDFVFNSDGKIFLNITFGSPMEEILIEKLTVKVVLPEGSKDIEVSVPFPTKQWQEVKYSHLDTAGRPVVVLEKPDVIPEHSLYFQVYYRFNNISLLRELLMLITGFFLLFVACIVYMRTDMSISKNSVQATIQQIQGIFDQCLAVHDKLEASLRDLSRPAAAHALCFAGLAAAHSLAGRGALVSDPTLALRHLVVCEAPLVIAVFSLLRRDPKRYSFLKAAARGLLGLPVGAFLNAFGAIVLGAPVGIKYWTETAYWSLLMSLFTFVPAACVFGASKGDWQNGLSHSIYCRSTDVVDYMISAPSHGAVIGAWLGAWPMPLDWERPWQEWPICVTYGAIAGHLIGMVVSLILIVAHNRRVRVKAD